MTEAERGAVAERAGRCCEYCFSQELLSHGDFTVEHIRPRSEGGSEHYDNFAWSCRGCNNRKRKYTAQTATDRAMGQVVWLYNPRTDLWRDHFVWHSDFSRIEGSSPVGRATVVRLDLNRAGVVNLRRALHLAGCHPPRLTMFERESDGI